MAILYSLRLYPNWISTFLPKWVDFTDSLIVDELPSIQISSERADVPLTTVVSDFSVTLTNAGNALDDIFDVRRIVGNLPPVAGSVLRAPIIHYGKVLFCRKSDLQSLWEVVFFGYIDPASVRFDRQEKKVTMTAYAPGKLLELGNAARINKVSSVAAAAPFVLANGNSSLTHPTAPPGSTIVDNSWWLLRNLSSLPLVGGDRFRVVRNTSAWVENMITDPISDDEYDIRQVVPDAANGLYIQTAQQPDILLGNGAASMELLTPWWRARTWESLVQELIAEVNAALVTVNTSEIVLVDTSNLPLLPATSQVFAQLIDMADVGIPVSGVAYAFWSSTRYLFFTYQPSSTLTQVAGKSNILGPINLGPISAPVFNPGTPVGYIPGPDDGLPVRFLSPNLDLGYDGGFYDAQGEDVSLCGQDLHIYENAGGFANNQRFDSTHWSRSPAGYYSGTEPKTFYRIYARGRYFAGNAGNPATAGFRRGITIVKFTTGNSGSTWTVSSQSTNLATIPLDSDPNAQIEPWFGTTGTSAQPDFKVFKLGVGSYLYCWTDPYKGEAYFKTSATGEEASSFFFPPPATFITPGASDELRPVNASGFICEGVGPGKGIFFFCDRADGGGVIPYIWNGSTFVFGSFNVALSLTGADFVNATIDKGRTRMYIALGKTLFVSSYTFNAGLGTFNWTAGYQFIPIDSVNYDQVAERGQNSINRPGALLWLTGPVVQNNAGEPNYTTASDAIIAASQYAIYIVSNVAANLVDYADFDGLSVAGALADLILVRGYQMISGSDQALVADPSLYSPHPLITFRARLIPNPTIIDLTSPINLCEGCEDGVWMLNFVAVGVQNSRAKPPIGPLFNERQLTNLSGASFTTNPPRNATSSALNIDNRFLGTGSFAQLLANIYAQDFLVPQPDATILLVDPYAAGYGLRLTPLDVVKYIRRPPDSTNNSADAAIGRVFSIDYGLDVNQLTVRVG